MIKPIASATLLSACLLSLLSACGGQTSPPEAESGSSGTSLPLGAALAQTGNVALFGQEQIAGIKIAEQYFNQGQGIAGTPIKLVIQDTGGR
ncbi:hypothetical protein [Neosynechococcus sphagnicola]|uniref:hypothetical protein n=1 Tax=Neosynechococcus sphagnicola TaxID=1501145 RepID=UPI003084202C